MGNFEEYKNVWIFAEQRNGKLMNVSLELVGEGKRLSEEIGQRCKTCAVLIGSDVEYLSEELYEFGADKVYLFDPKLRKHINSDGYAKVMTEAIVEYKPQIVLFGATHIGRDLAPRIAARLNTGLTADCTRLDLKTSSYMDYLKALTTARLTGLD